MSCCQGMGLEGNPPPETRWVRAFQGCRDKCPCTRRLTTTGIYSHSVLEARSPRSRCGQGWFLDMLREVLSVPLPALVGYQQSMSLLGL